MSWQDPVSHAFFFLSGHANVRYARHIGKYAAKDQYAKAGCSRNIVLFCFVLFALQLSVCLWWHDYRRDGFPTLKFGVVMADLLAICRERSPLH